MGPGPALADLCAFALDVETDDQPLPLTHGFHSYPARFHPLLPRRILAAQPAARRVLDPFVGSGTTVVEAAMAGRTAFGTDINPLSILLSRLKSTASSPAQRQALVASAAVIAARALEQGKAARRSGAQVAPPSSATRFDDPTMYPPHVYRELCALRLAIDEQAPPAGERWLRDALLLTLSSIVIKVSLQRSDTDPRRVERAIARGAAARLFAVRARLLDEQLAAFAARVPAGTPAPDLRRSDARRLRHLESGSIDLVITSPPYLGTYDYAAHHERRFGWLGLDGRALSLLRKSELGARREAGEPAAAMARFRHEVSAYLGEVARVLAPTGAAFVLMGDSVVAGRAVPGDAELLRAAGAHGLELAGAARQRRPASLRVDGEAGQPERHEHLLALRRR